MAALGRSGKPCCSDFRLFLVFSMCYLVEIDLSRKATVTDRGACMPRRDKVDIWALSDHCTPWCVHVVATLRIADHIAAGVTQLEVQAAGRQPSGRLVIECRPTF